MEVDTFCSEVYKKCQTQGRLSENYLDISWFSQLGIWSKIWNRVEINPYIQPIDLYSALEFK